MTAYTHQFALCYYAENVDSDEKAARIEADVKAALEREFATMVYRISRRYGGGIKVSTTVCLDGSSKEEQ